MRRWISLGGWCGPSLMLTKLGLRPGEESLPFDMVRCTFDGIVELTTNGFSSSSSSSRPPAVLSSNPREAHGSASAATSAAPYLFPRDSFDGFFPLPQSSYSSREDNSATAYTFTPDPVSVWLLFRSQHACFTHFDLNNPEVQRVLQQRMREWDALLSPRGYGSAGSTVPRRPVTFIRTAIAENPADEMEMLPQFHSTVRRRTEGQLSFRTVLVVHDQAEVTQPLCSFPQEASEHQTPCILWNIKREATLSASAAMGSEPSLLDQCHSGYQTVLTTMCKEQKWRSLCTELPSYAAYMKLRGKPFEPYRELSRVAGVPAVRGTCTGFGSTFSAALGRCVHCGCIDGHPVVANMFDTRQPWKDEDMDDLLMNYALHQCDEVAAVEATSLKQKRGAHETWLKLKEMLSD